MAEDFVDLDMAQLVNDMASISLSDAKRADAHKSEEDEMIEKMKERAMRGRRRNG